MGSVAGRDTARTRKRRKFLIAYAGKFYIERDPQPLFRALRTLIDSGEIEREQVRVDLVGWCETSEGRSGEGDGCRISGLVIASTFLARAVARKRSAA